MADPVAVYGAVTGTAGALAAGWVVYNGLFRDRARLKVEPSLAIMDSQLLLRCVAVEVSNIGRRPASVQSCRLAAKDGRRFVFLPRSSLKYGDVGLVIDQSHDTPRRLDEGESHTFYIPLDDVKQSAADEQLTLVSVHIQDGSGKTWKKALPKSLRRALMSAVK